MASSGKKNTFAKLARESRLRERRLEKQANKDARKRASENQPTQLDGTYLPRVSKRNAAGDGLAARRRDRARPFAASGGGRGGRVQRRRQILFVARIGDGEGCGSLPPVRSFSPTQRISSGP